jgi:poly(hydroxyalkanoate) granule-associated protein
MAEDIEVQEEVIAENGYNHMLEIARKVLLAGIGAVVLAQEEIEEFVNKLVERGEIAEKDGRRLMKDVIERRKKKAEEVRSDTEEQFEQRMEEILTHMNIPSKSDIDDLSKKVTALSRKVDQLKKEQSE